MTSARKIFSDAREKLAKTGRTVRCEYPVTKHLARLLLRSFNIVESKIHATKKGVAGGDFLANPLDPSTRCAQTERPGRGAAIPFNFILRTANC